MSVKTIYLDNNATTRVAPEVRDALLPYLCESFGNPSSMHAFGGSVASAVSAAREEVARFINAEPDEIIFTSCATESDNAAIRGSMEVLGSDARLITTVVEHPAVLQPCRRLKAQGREVIEVGVDSLGNLKLDELRQALSGAKKALVSVMWANNETGVVNPMAEISEICREYGAQLHTDAVQVAGKIEVDVKKVPVDMLAMSGHKFHAPKGVGFLYVRRGAKWRPFMLGGHQESGKRAGTENVPYIVGLAKACELARRDMASDNVKIERLRNRLEEGILSSCLGVRINGNPAARLSNTLNVSFEYIEGESIAYKLSDLGICISTGSACASGSLDPSHVIRAMGVPYTAVHGSVRFSLSRETTDAEIDYVLEKLPPVIKELRDMSPFGPGQSLTTFN
jgi:cysteine desulfurase